MTFPVVIQNLSGLNLSQHKIYVTVVGQNNSISPEPPQQFYDVVSKKWYNNQSSYRANQLTDLLKTSGSNAGQYVLDIPFIDSGRVYLSIDQPLVFNGISPPSVSNPSGKSFPTKFDFFELTYLKSQAYPFINTTNVDYYGGSLSLQETLVKGTTKTVGFTNSRLVVLDRLVNQLQANGNWQQLIQQDSAGNIIRVVSPQQAIVNNPPLTQNFDASFYLNYIDKVWRYYAQPGHTLTVDMTEIAKWNPGYSKVLFKGRVINDQFVFSSTTSINPVTKKPFATIVTNRPMTSDQVKNSVFGVSDLFDTPNQTPRSVVNKNLGAAFNLGILADPQYPGNLNLTPPTSAVVPAQDGWQKYVNEFYKQKILTSGGVTIPAYNVYSGALQSVAAGGFVYGFPYSDVVDKDPTLSDKNAVSATVTIQQYQEINLIKGNKSSNYLYGNSSSKSFIIYGDWGNNALEGNDTLIGNVKEDAIYGEDGNDRLGGLLGNDTLYGGGGNDYLNGGGGLDTLIGNGGNDIFIISSTNDRVIEISNQGIDTVRSVVSYSLSSNLERLSLQGIANINATGNNLNNYLFGNSGNNILNGLGGNDTLIGNAGNDILVGASGNDILTGGSGNNRFYYLTGAVFSPQSIGIDRITDFSRTTGNVDKIVLSRTTFNAGTNFASVSADALAATSAAHITFSTSTGRLFYNQNGSAAGLGTGGQFATLSSINGSLISPLNTLQATDLTITA